MFSVRTIALSWKKNVNCEFSYLRGH